MKVGFEQNQLLSQLHKLTDLVKTGAVQAGSGVAGTPGAGNVEFGNLLTKAINSVNNTQMESSRAAASIEAGDGGVSLVKAMIASQKANVSFQATVQVRNKIVSAYQDIMNMPI